MLKKLLNLFNSKKDKKKENIAHDYKTVDPTQKVNKLDAKVDSDFADEDAFIGDAGNKDENKIIKDRTIPKVLLVKDPAIRKTWLETIVTHDLKTFRNKTNPDKSHPQGVIILSPNKVLLNNLLDQALHVGIDRNQIHLIFPELENTCGIDLWDAPVDQVAHRLRKLFQFKDWADISILNNYCTLYCLVSDLKKQKTSMNGFLRFLRKEELVANAVKDVKLNFIDCNSLAEMDHLTILLNGEKSLHVVDDNVRQNTYDRLSQLIIWFETMLHSYENHKEDTMQTSLVYKVIKVINSVQRVVAKPFFKNLFLNKNTVSFLKLLSPTEKTGIVLIHLPDSAPYLGEILVSTILRDRHGYEVTNPNLNFPLLPLYLSNWDKYASPEQLVWLSEMKHEISLTASAKEKFKLSEHIANPLTDILCYVDKQGLNGNKVEIDYPLLIKSAKVTPNNK
ncbi:hypothetical protein [uncultured Lactobacillus sp.]|uniref:hypothetical protein n=1 Tax=uncultured Lactobacillus sp. TaxID=153152 RepID=UPI00260D8BA1|nr:hypothetical protein [uncultured Lactobacillus sp.]